ncbi:sodium- and chloride-dependent glycine transporter 1-like [Mercenaria mercenaria]|uniref:sodium- and chloride-dependent glycine transporter 1-like n=1 Tax=Mercenaria mercenaria TaxID=6596 RepID=UPI00234FB5CA|nr:sodium- and chloride-dependent glycine transporter 1-like [Mercenaria mercenaria]XP_053402449.1 sodium- and chloride-dependent glycine transporter 1-like [Mercenaria mercenaria]
MARQRWGRRIEFFLTTVGYSVGVGDLWRFPYLVMKNGGGAFLIPIVIFNVFGAMPIVYMEMIMGQYSQSGAVPAWNVCPLLKGVGYGTLIATFIFSIYYAVIICWMLFYFFYSFFPTLPWTTCDNEWNIKETCVENSEALYKETGRESVVSNITTTIATSLSTVTQMTSNMSTTGGADFVAKVTSAEQFWKYKALELSEGLEDMGTVNWAMLGCLAAIEIACFLCIFKGVKLTGKVVYFTVLGPFVLLLVFLVRGAILPGADIGIKYYITPDVEKLKEPRIWAEACMQVFFSIGPGLGAMITFASYNKFSNNCMRDAILVCLLDLMTGFIGGFVVFSVLGHVSYRTGIDIKNFNQSGYGLGFIAYPEAANYLPPPQLWCILFFFMSVFLGIDSQFPSYEIVVTALKDEFPKHLKGKTTLLTFLVILIAFLLAIPQVMEGGFYLLTLVDWYTATFSLTIISLFELLVMSYVYGMKRLDENMHAMTGKCVPVYFKICWYFLTPLLLAVTVGFTIYSYAPPTVDNYEYPDWSVAIGWCIASASLAPIPLYMIYKLIKTPGSLLERFRVNLRPNEKWGPPRELLEPEIISPDKLWSSADIQNGVISPDSAEERKEGLDNLAFNTKL